MPLDRIERIKAFSKIALGILRRCGERCNVDREGGRCRLSEVRHNEFRLTYSRCDDEDRTSTLDVRFNGKTVLHIEWTAQKVTDIVPARRLGNDAASIRSHARYGRVRRSDGLKATLTIHGMPRLMIGAGSLPSTHQVGRHEQT